jgi:fructose-bisphosphate aldolase/2-amino-3,7-dideoxy-D-threo-hept-6-ulosonate synthase
MYFKNLNTRKIRAYIGVDILNLGKKYRLGKIFREDGKALIVAMDHGLRGPIAGLEQPEVTIKKLLAGKPDAILTNLGILQRYADQLSKLPGIILTIPSDKRALQFIPLAARIGADAVKVSVFEPISNREKFEIFWEIAAECEEYSIPLLAEPAPIKDVESRSLVTDVNIIKKVARQAAEMGADFLKIAYTGSVESFREVIDTCANTPVVIMGGPKMETVEEVLQTVKGSIDAGGNGVAIGRNIWQFEDPTAMVRAMRKIIHENASVQEAMEEIKHK